MSRRFFLNLVVLAVVAVAMGTGPVYSQVVTDPIGDLEVLFDQPPTEPNAFGTMLQTYVIPVADFVPQSSMEYAYAGNGYIYRTDGPGTTLWAPLTLPAGAQTSVMVALVYDASAADITAQWGAYALHQGGSPGPSFVNFSSGTSSGTGGYTYIWFAAAPTLIRYYADIDDDGTDDWVAYRVSVSLPTTTSDTRFAGVALSWQRTIAPAPASATFVDVPVGSFGFRHVEALYASGITTGCDATHFCPNQTLTRVQMAVFLAKALGLHWED